MVAMPWSLQLCTGKQNAELLAPNDDRFEVGHIDALGHSVVLIANISFQRTKLKRFADFDVRAAF